VTGSSYKNVVDFNPEFVTDGLVDGRIFHTETEANPWIRVDLLELFHVNAIKIWNRPLSNDGKLIFLSAIV